MSIAFNPQLLAPFDHGQEAKRQPDKDQRMAVQQWQKTFDEALAKSSQCQSVAPQAMVSSRIDGVLAVAGEEVAPTGSGLAPLAYPSRGQEPARSAFLTATEVAMPQGSWQVGASGSNMLAVFGHSLTVATRGERAVVEPSVEAAAAAKTLPASTEDAAPPPAIKLLVLLEQDQARLWMRHTEGTRRQSEAMLAKLSQGLRAKNIYLSSLVVNGQRVF